MKWRDVLESLAAGKDLSVAESVEVFDQIFSGEVQPDDIAALLTHLHNKGESQDEILGAVTSMRRHMTPLSVAPEFTDRMIDIVGTGGDNHGTYNISTATSFVVAGCGVPVAKHGNRAATSKSGSSDVLRELGINLEPTQKALESCLPEAGIVFLFAPRHHPAMRHVADVRRKLGFRTIFNILGPLTNPAGARRHLIGVFEAARMEPMAHVLRESGSLSAWMTHGHDGMDEITTTGPTSIVSFDAPDAALRRFEVQPSDLGLPFATLDDLRGDTPAANAAALRRLLAGGTGAYRNIVVINAAAALVVAGRADNLQTASLLAAESIDSGAAQKTLDRLVAVSNLRACS